MKHISLLFYNMKSQVPWMQYMFACKVFQDMVLSLKPSHSWNRVDLCISMIMKYTNFSLLYDLILLSTMQFPHWIIDSCPFLENSSTWGSVSLFLTSWISKYVVLDLWFMYIYLMSPTLLRDVFGFVYFVLT